MVRRRFSRLQRKEEARSLRQAIVFGFLTVLFALGLLFLGIPALIKMAIFLGNLRSSTIPIETQDTLAPPAPRLKPLPEATNSAQIKIDGLAESKTTVEIFLSGIATKEVIAEEDGTFSFVNLRLTTGKNEIMATATDDAGNTSQESGKIVIYYDKEPPELEISEPTENATLYGAENKLTLKGKTEEKATVTIDGHMVIVDSEGNFEYSLNLSEGENKFLIIATDNAGNQTEKEIMVTYSP